MFPIVTQKVFAYTSASINTLGRFEFQYGRVEVRAKLPAGTGAWPAIWTLGTNRQQVGWPACGDIDIMENVGFDPHPESRITDDQSQITHQKSKSRIATLREPQGRPELVEGRTANRERHHDAVIV